MQMRCQEKRGLAARQARVGIMANQVDLALPTPPPKDVWTRWPNLQSARRQNRKAAAPSDQKLVQDHVLNGDRLNSFAQKMRESSLWKKLSQVGSDDVKLRRFRLSHTAFCALPKVFSRRVYFVALAMLLGLGGMLWHGP